MAPGSAAAGAARKKRIASKRKAGATLKPSTKQSTLCLIGIGRDELSWLRTLVWLLRHPDPAVPELARQALLYLTGAAREKSSTGAPQNEPTKVISGNDPYRAGRNLVS
jgi:hypothetical protein